MQTYTYLNPPYGNIGVIGSKKFFREFGLFLTERYQDKPETTIIDINLKDEFDEFCKLHVPATVTTETIDIMGNKLEAIVLREKPLR